MTLLTDLPVSLAIFLAAGGWGWLAVRRLAPRGTDGGLLVVTSTAAGLWMLGTALLIVGTFVGGSLSPYVWWPVVAGGLAAAAVAARGPLRTMQIPSHLNGASVFWILAAIAAAFWIAGASMPPGLVGRLNGDYYDVLSYHLQVPRKFYDAGRIGYLPHNTYSSYPLGGEMIFLLATILRGGPYEGAFAAQYTHGLWGVLAMLAVMQCASRRDAWRRRSAAVLLVTVPWVTYLSWLGFVELLRTGLAGRGDRLADALVAHAVVASRPDGRPGRRRGLRR